MTQGEFLNLTLGIVLITSLVIDVCCLLWGIDEDSRSSEYWAFCFFMGTLTVLTWVAIFFRIGGPKQ